jgi:EAL domain-containing protein (putative c-di-GMP-specific phosphodiesterase class I)
VDQGTGVEEAIRRAADPLVLIKRVAEEAMTLVAGVEGVLVGFVHDPLWVSFDCGAGAVAGHVGACVPVQGSMAGLAFTTGETLHSKDAGSDTSVDFNFSRVTNVRSLVCVPLWRSNRTVGVLCVTSREPGAFDDRDLATLTSLAKFISVVIAVAFDLANVTDELLSRVSQSRADSSSKDDRAAETRFVANVLSPGTMKKIESRTWIDRFLKGSGTTLAFQPIYDVTTGRCFAVEALTRFSGQPLRTPDLWFAEAHEMGVGVELELVSVRKSLRCLQRVPSGIDLCVNVGPEAMMSTELLQLLATVDGSRIVMELTEQAHVDDYPRLARALEHLYAMGVRLAIDDTGAGFASLAHILKLAPNIIKLDRELTSGIDRDPVRITLAAALVSFAAGLGAEIVAEGIETASELERLRELGIRFGQGFYLCRPTSIELVPLWMPPTLVSLEPTIDRHVSRSGQLLAFPARR